MKLTKELGVKKKDAAAKAKEKLRDKRVRKIRGSAKAVAARAVRRKKALTPTQVANERRTGVRQYPSKK